MVRLALAAQTTRAEASSLTIGKTMAIGFSLGSLTQNKQEGMVLGTIRDPSLDQKGQLWQTGAKEEEGHLQPGDLRSLQSKKPK